MINKFTIFGERCSGTNYLENIIKSNFEIEITWKYGWKHFFGFSNYDNSDNVLFIGIIRNPFDWINSLFLDKHHLAPHLRDNVQSFLNKEFWSIHSNSNLGEIMEDRNILTKERYKNIFELRAIKNKYLLEILPIKVKNYIIIRYEDLIYNFIDTINKIKNIGLLVKPNINYPININYDCKYLETYNKDKKKHKKNLISRQLILNNPNINLYYERKLKYI
jgi:hypothetical protein